MQRDDRLGSDLVCVSVLSVEGRVIGCKMRTVAWIDAVKVCACVNKAVLL